MGGEDPKKMDDREGGRGLGKIIISWFDMWFNIVKPRFLFKTVDLWSYINA